MVLSVYNEDSVDTLVGSNLDCLNCFCLHSYGYDVLILFGHKVFQSNFGQIFKSGIKTEGLDVCSTKVT